MMNRLPLVILIFALIFAGSCGSTDAIDDDNGTTEPPVEPVNYSLTASAYPTEGGSVSPAGGEYEEGTDVSLEASAEPGFSFSGWEGDLSGNDNPAVITMDSNKEIMALFEDLRSEYSVELILSDGVDQIELEFGQSADGEGASVLAPPSPPEGALDGRFVRDDDKLFKDYRINTHVQAEWVLAYQAGEENQLTLSWDIESVQMEGVLVLSSPLLEEEVDMLEQSEVTFIAEDSGSFTILYSREN